MPILLLRLFPYPKLYRKLKRFKCLKHQHPFLLDTSKAKMSYKGLERSPR